MAITLTAATEFPAGDAASSQARKARRKSVDIGQFFNKITQLELIYFTSQLALMLEVGTALNVAVRALASQATNNRFKKILLDMAQHMEEGQQLSQAMLRHPRVFDGVFVAMVKAGETGGYLKEALDRTAAMKERRMALVTQVRSALTYPIILCVMASGVVVFILTGVDPKFMGFFAGKESILPATTRFMMAASTSLRGYWWAYLLGLAVVSVCWTLFRHSAVGKRSLDWAAIRLPPMASLANRVCTCQLLRTLGHLMESQVPLLEALEVTKTTMQNSWYAEFVDDAMEQVRGGGRLSGAFLRNRYIVDSVRQMIATGEEAGNLYPVMLRLADFYDKEIEQKLKTLAAMIEPAALIVLGSIVAVIVTSVVVPMFKLAHAIT